MCSFSEEMFLRDYFTFDAVVGSFCDARAIFNCLANNYYIDSERREKLFSLVTNDSVGQITSLKDYKRYRRLRQYVEACGLSSNYSDVEDDVITIKGKALYLVAECGLANSGTKASVYSAIVNKANAGQVVALRIYGTLQCEGIFFEKRLRDGIKNLTRAARWNSIESILALLNYDNVDSKKYIDMLYTLAYATPYEDVAKSAQIKHEINSPEKLKECILLSKVFGRGFVKPNVYIPLYANLLYSEVVSFKDKEKILLSENKEFVSSCRDLPLKLAMGKFDYDISAITGLPLKREVEQNGIIQNAINSDIRDFHTFRPLCLCSDSKYMRSYYASAITKLYGNAHIEYVSVADLCPNDFEPTPNNIFVRSCNEDKNNVFIISFVGDVNETAAKAVCDFLQSEKRGKMHLSVPCIEINLGAVLPICLCDKSNAAMLARFCEKLDVLSPDQAEQRIIIRELMTEKAKQYGIEDFKVEAQVVDKLCSVSVDTANSALDAAIVANRNGRTSLKLTEFNTAKYIKHRDSYRGYGYGGCKDDI